MKMYTSEASSFEYDSSEDLCTKVTKCVQNNIVSYSTVRILHNIIHIIIRIVCTINKLLLIQLQVYKCKRLLVKW